MNKQFNSVPPRGVTWEQFKSMTVEVHGIMAKYFPDSCYAGLCGLTCVLGMLIETYAEEGRDGDALAEFALMLRKGPVRKG